MDIELDMVDEGDRVRVLLEQIAKLEREAEEDAKSDSERAEIVDSLVSALFAQGKQWRDLVMRVEVYGVPTLKADVLALCQEWKRCQEVAAALGLRIEIDLEG